MRAGRCGALLVEAELATAEQIFRALSARFGVPVVSDERLAEVTPPEPLKRAISRAEALLAGMFPIDLSADGQRATVVMVDPSDEQTLADFLTRAQVPEGRALLARRDAITRAIERVWGETTAVVTPLPPGRRKGVPAAKRAPQVVQAITDDDVTGTVKLDPSLQAEMSRLPPRALSQADALTPLPQRRPAPTLPTPPPAPRRRGSADQAHRDAVGGAARRGAAVARAHRDDRGAGDGAGGARRRRQRRRRGDGAAVAARGAPARAAAARRRRDRRGGAAVRARSADAPDRRRRLGRRVRRARLVGGGRRRPACRSCAR